MAIDREFYNKSSASNLGWTPSWFGEHTFDESLTKAVKLWQKDNHLTADGLVGPMTFRRIYTEREANIHMYTPKGETCGGDNFIIYNSRPIPIDWEVVLWSEPHGLRTAEGNYTPHIGGDRPIDFFVNHWDVCLSSESCARVLDKRGISVHWCIDNDGIIYQLLDANQIAWQAGGRGVNKRSLGVEISNAYYTKYDRWYERNGFGKRPRVTDAKCHGRTLPEHLGFYPVQIEALKALWGAVHRGIGVPLDVPTNEEGELIDTVVPDCLSKGKYKGFVNHYNLTRNKIDCAGLDMLGILSDVKDIERRR